MIQIIKKINSICLLWCQYRTTVRRAEYSSITGWVWKDRQCNTNTKANVRKCLSREWYSNPRRDRKRTGQVNTRTTSVRVLCIRLGGLSEIRTKYELVRNGDRCLSTLTTDCRMLALPGVRRSRTRHLTRCVPLLLAIHSPYVCNPTIICNFVCEQPVRAIKETAAVGITW